MNKKNFITICAILFIAIIVSSILINNKSETYTDAYGFTHNSDRPSKPYVEDENMNRDYAIVSLNKEEAIGMSQHEFINKVTPVLNNYADKKYTTFVFEDGTGIFFPYSSTVYTAAYGLTDENGNITEEFGTVKISGTQAIYSEINASLSSETADVYNYIPEKFVNDGLAVCSENGSLYIAISQTILSDEDLEPTMDDFMTGFRKFNLSDYTKLNIALNRRYGYSVNTRTLSVTRDDSVIETVLNKVGLY